MNRLPRTTAGFLGWSMRVCFFGTSGGFSSAALAALLAAGVHVCGVVVPAPQGGVSGWLAPPPQRSALPLVEPFVERTTVALAWAHALPVLSLARLAASEARALLASVQPDVAYVACFPRRIPSALRAVPLHGFVNLHPALLPAHRGPAPLFWVFRNGDSHAGVTLHQMDAGLDTGPIVAQAACALVDGSTAEQVEQWCARRGAALLAEALVGGAIQSWPQPDGGSYEPWPASADFAIDPRWSARRAFNFMRGTASWGQPYPLPVGDACLVLRAAQGFDLARRLDTPYQRTGDHVEVQFTPGVLSARLECW